MTTSDERTLGILLAKVEAIQDTLSRAEQSRANMHRRLDEVVKEVGDLKTDVESMRGTVAASKEITDEVKAWNTTGYRWIERQDPHDAMRWVSINNALLLVADSTDLAQVPIGQVIP